MVLFELEVCGAKMEQSLHRVYRAAEVSPPPPPKEPWCSVQFYYCELARRGLRVWAGSRVVKSTLTAAGMPRLLAPLNRCSLDGLALRLASRGSWPVSSTARGPRVSIRPFTLLA